MNRLPIIIALFGISMFTACQSAKSEAIPEKQDNSDSVLVEVKKMIPERFAHHVTINGAVEAVLEAFVSPETNGQIKKIHVHEGQRVDKGDILISLNSDAIRSGIAEVESGLELATTVYERRRDLWEKKIGSEIQYLEAKTNKVSLENRLKTLQAQLDMAEIKAPITGIVDRISLKVGELAMPGMELIHLINLKRMRVNAELAESYLGSIKAQDPLELTFPTYPDRKLMAQIKRISQTINAKNRTVTIQVEIDNDDESIKPNMMATLRLNDFMDEQALVLPAIVIKNDMKGRFVYITEGTADKLVARKVYVEIGLTDEGQTMITSGISDGQQVIVVGYNQVSNGMNIRLP